MLAAVTALESGAATQEKPVVSIERVAWLQGCWESASPQRTVEEQWMAPRGGVMLGMGRTVRDGKLVEYESVLIREANGRLAYDAHPSGQAPATFLSTTVSERTVVFENPQHDFPQKVGYTLNPNGVTGWIDGTMAGKSRRVEFPYRQVDCPR